MDSAVDSAWGDVMDKSVANGCTVGLVCHHGGMMGFLLKTVVNGIALWVAAALISGPAFLVGALFLLDWTCGLRRQPPQGAS